MVSVCLECFWASVIERMKYFLVSVLVDSSQNSYVIYANVQYNGGECKLIADDWWTLNWRYLKASPVIVVLKVSSL